MRYAGNTLYMKQGESFSFAGAALDPATRQPIDVTGLIATSQIRTARVSRALIGTMACEWLSASVLKISYPDDTIEWPAGRAIWDIRVVDAAGNVCMTDTVSVNIDHYVTGEP